ncbi:hypothetical protein FRC01_002394, partial [Tulasnella sp. 417]
MGEQGVGVPNAEHTAQEDLFVTLFGTALSNLVVFRGDFAPDRDIVNMFRSFRAYTHLLDPASNPTLFKGLLVVVIKDVVDTEKQEIAE